MKLISASSMVEETKVLSKDFTIKGWKRDVFFLLVTRTLLTRLGYSLTCVYLQPLIPKSPSSQQIPQL